MPKQSNNQKLIKIGKEVCNNNSKDNYYAKINLNALQNAMIDLNTEASHHEQRYTDPQTKK